MRPQEKFQPTRLPPAATLPATALVYKLEEPATRYPDKGAIRFCGRRLSYSELKRQADALAGRLQRVAGLAAGDRVLLYLQNAPQFVIGTCGILRADAVVRPVGSMRRLSRRNRQVDDRAAPRSDGSGRRQRRHRPVACAQGRVQGAAVGAVCRRTAGVRHRQDHVARAATARKRVRGGA